MTQVTYTEPVDYLDSARNLYTDSRFPGWEFEYDVHASKLPIGSGTVTRVVNNNPDWKTKVQKGEDASSYYFRDGWRWKAPSAFADTLAIFPEGYKVTGTGLVRGFGGVLTSPTYDDLNDVAVRDKALAILKSKLSKELGSARVMAPTAEIRELRGLVNQAVGFTYQLLVALAHIQKRLGPSHSYKGNKRQRNSGDFRQFGKLIADTYLAWVFAINPLVRDVEAAANAVESWLTTQDRTVRLSGAFGKTWVTGQKNTGTGTVHQIRESERHTLHRLSYKFISAFDLLVASSNDYSLGSHLGFSVSNVVPTAWELLPFSWVIDYFTTVGEFLEDTFSSSPTTTKYVVECKKYTAVSGYSTFFRPPSDSHVNVIRQGSSRGMTEYFQFSRTPLLALPKRALRFHSLDAIGFHGLSKLLNLTAVLAKGRL